MAAILNTAVRESLPEEQTFEPLSTKSRGVKRSHGYLVKENLTQRGQYTKAGGCPFYSRIGRTVTEWTRKLVGDKEEG